MFIEKLKENFKNNEPIFTKEILNCFSEYTRAYVFRLIKEAEKEQKLIKFDKGIYFLPTKTDIGISTITVEDVVTKKYISYKHEVYGLYCGLGLLNYFSVTTQMPNTIELVSNKETTRCRRININGRTILLRKSRCTINSKNKDAYTILQLLSEIRDDTELNSNLKNKIKEYMELYKVNKSEIVNMLKYFPAQATRNLVHSGVLNVLA